MTQTFTTHELERFAEAEVLLGKKLDWMIKNPPLKMSVDGAPAECTAQHKGVNFKSKRFFTKPEIKAEMWRINLALRKHVPKTPIEGPIALRVLFVFPLTTALAKKNAARLSDLKLTLYKVTRPDSDNSLKLLQDQMSKMKFWKDDSHVTDTYLYKRYGVTPRIDIAIIPLWPEGATNFSIFGDLP